SHARFFFALLTGNEYGFHLLDLKKEVYSPIMLSPAREKVKLKFGGSKLKFAFPRGLIHIFRR
ncbi:MAG: hypothetical protein ACI4P3_00850, partial [Candidatus Spyradosoma sp.]